MDTDKHRLNRFMEKLLVLSAARLSDGQEQAGGIVVEWKAFLEPRKARKARKARKGGYGRIYFVSFVFFVVNGIGGGDMSFLEKLLDVVEVNNG